MTLQDWGAIGEMVGGVAVLISLIYLALQIRQNTREVSRGVEATRLDAFERSVASGNRIRELLILNPDLASLFLRGAQDFHALDRNEKFRMNMLLRNMFSEFQSAYVRQRTWSADPEGHSGQAKTIDSILVNPGVRQWISEANADWRAEFRTFVEERLAATEPADKPSDIAADGPSPADS